MTASHREASNHQTQLPEYNVWVKMKARCNRPREISYPRYGGRGIRVCERWSSSFLAFYDDVGPRPSTSHSLDRIDNDGHYEPSNVRWATRQQQGANTGRRVDNTSGFRGVAFNYKKWSAAVRYDNQDYYIGSYETSAEAAWMRDQWALALHGEFATLNFQYLPVAEAVA